MRESWYLHPPEETNTGPGFNRGSGGGARGCGFKERVGAHARSEEGSISYSRFCLCVCVPWHTKWRLVIHKKVQRSPRRFAESTPWPQGRWLIYARRRALPVCGSDNPRRAGVVRSSLRRAAGKGAETGARKLHTQ